MSCLWWSIFISNFHGLTVILIFIGLHVFYNHKCFVFPCLGAPGPPFLPPPGPSFSHLLLSMDILRFSFKHNCLNPATPQPVSSCCVHSCMGNFFCFSVNCLATHFLANAGSPASLWPSFCTARLVPWWGFLDPCSPHICPLDDICSSLLTGLCASNRPSFKTATQELLKTWMWSFHRRA